MSRPLYRGFPLPGGSVIRGFTVVQALGNVGPGKLGSTRPNKGIGLNISLMQGTTVLKTIMGLSEAGVCINTCMYR